MDGGRERALISRHRTPQIPYMRDEVSVNRLACSEYLVPVDEV
jgi:hypothetical protein